MTGGAFRARCNTGRCYAAVTKRYLEGCTPRRALITDGNANLCYPTTPEHRVKRWFLLASAVAIAACGSDSGKGSSDTAKQAGASVDVADLTGAGATFPYPLYNRWVSEYRAKTGAKINYQNIGSGGGIKQLQEQTVDFGASDAPMTDVELSSAKGGPIIHIPTIVGVVALAYNLPDVTQPLKLTGPVVADIFLGRITKWNDQRIAALNSGVKLPNTDILVVHRTEGSGTTYIFSDYLSAVSPAWKAGPGKGKELQWPVGLGARGNEGVAGQIKQTPGAFGYVELAFARQSRLGIAELQNRNGKFVAPSAGAATAAAEAAIAQFAPTTDYRVSIVNAAGDAAYPIASFTWLLVYRKMPDARKAKTLADFIRFGLTDGQKDAVPLDYAALPSALATRLVARADSIALAPAAK
jgi:phosphate transport system substrate-binding protein